jgi:hypothetical protein
MHDIIDAVGHVMMNPSWGFANAFGKIAQV